MTKFRDFVTCEKLHLCNTLDYSNIRSPTVIRVGSTVWLLLTLKVIQDR